MAGEALERLHIRVCGVAISTRSIDRSNEHCRRLTSQDVSLEMFISSERLSTVCTEDHVGQLLAGGSSDVGEAEMKRCRAGQAEQKH